MSLRAEPILVFRNAKTGRDLNNFLIQSPIPRIGEGVVSENKKLFRVKDVVTHSYWHNNRIQTEVRIFVEASKT